MSAHESGEHGMTKYEIREDSKMAGTEIATAEDRLPEAPAVTSIMVLIERAMIEGADIDKLERLLLMQERILERQAVMAYNSALAAVQAEMVPVLRDAKNDQTRSKYARLEDISKAVTPITTSHGFAMSFGSDVSPLENHYRITCRVSHAAGHACDYHADVPADLTGMKGVTNKTATHAFGSTMSYGRRYLKLLIFDIATEDDDGNRAGAGPTVSPEQFVVLRDLVEATGSREAAMLKAFGAPSLEQFPLAKYKDAVASLQRKLPKETA